MKARPFPLVWNALRGILCVPGKKAGPARHIGIIPLTRTFRLFYVSATNQRRLLTISGKNKQFFFRPHAVYREHVLQAVLCGLHTVRRINPALRGRKWGRALLEGLFHISRSFQTRTRKESGMGIKYLSDEWFAKVEDLAKEVNLEIAPGLATMKINMTITSDAGNYEWAISAGKIQKGHVSDATTKITVPYDLAKRMFVDEDRAAGMQAFTSGKMKIEGDMSKLMAMQSIQPTASQKLLQAKIKEITE
jgi:hypothetical protein